ncbi:MAG: CHAD domain-containing protein [Candidatus Limnocylindrales bacterium]|jgi:CHAD domain-containing protein
MVTGRRIEVEMKYEVRGPDGADRYLVAPELGQFRAAGPVRIVRIEDRYVDSADWALSRSGFAARLRRTPHETVIGLKRQATPDGPLARREELEGPADSESTPTDWPASPARSVILELCGDAPLVELLTIRQVRRIRGLEGGDTTAELSVDQVEVLAEGRSLSRFDEMEVELEAGPEEPLQALGPLLDADAGLHRSSRSKLERAVRAVGKALPTMPDEVRLRWLDAPPTLFGRRRRPRSKAPAEASDAGQEAADTASPERQAQPAGDSDTARQERVPAATRPTGPRTLGVLPDDSLPEAARKVINYHFARLRARERGTRDGSNVEDLHDMRVAARRIRAAWRIFNDAFKPGRTRKLRRRLRILSERLGVVRDLDVLIDGLEAYRLGLDPDQQPGLEPLLALWRRQRNSARDLLIAELDSGRYADFVDDMKDFLEAGANEAATVASPTLPHRVRDRVPSQIWAAYETVRAYEPVLPWADVETLHQLRIATKWLRYDLEFFGETLGRDSARLLGRVVALQDFLGCLHDADVAAKLSRDILVARSGELSRAETEAIGAYLHSRERELARRRRALGPVWRAVAGAPFRRALGRATAAL